MTKKNQKIILIALMVLLILSLTACKSEKVSVMINDMNTQTIVEVPVGCTVEQALKEAEILLSDKDEISLSSDTVLKANDEITVSRYSQVKLNHDGEIKTISVVGGTVAQAIQKSGIKLAQNEVVNYDNDVFLTDGMEIVITKCINVSLTVDGKTEKFLVKPCKVKDFLTEKNIKIGKKDIVIPELKTMMNNDTQLTVKRVTTKTITETQNIKYETVYKTSSSMAAGTSKTTQKGKNGRKTVKYIVTYIDGKESERNILSETVIEEPVPEIIVRSSKKKENKKTIVSKQSVPDCDGSGHGYYVITWSDGSVTYEEY